MNIHSVFSFTIHSSDPTSAARTGTFETPHGSFQTPCFMPCGTKATVKTLTPDDLRSLRCEMVLANTYHLMLRPGAEVIEKMGGLHSFTSWNGPILTDSGGFQIFSLSGLRRITDEGVTFQSHIDGSTHVMTPEAAIQIQEQLGADIIMAFDECPPGTADYSYAKKSLARTHSWALRCIKAKKRIDQALFPIVQGVTYKDLRTESARFMSELSLPGIAIGGLAVGEKKSDMLEMLQTVCPILPLEKPRYLMGVGEPIDIIEAVLLGVDMFDCVLPTRLARHGAFFTLRGRKNIAHQQYKLERGPLEKNCACYTCLNFSASYLRHLMREGEMLGHRLLTLHNLHFLLDLMRIIRAQIAAGTLKQFAHATLTQRNDEIRK